MVVLSPEEERFLGQWRRLKKTYQDYRLEIIGSVKQRRRDERFTIQFSEHHRVDLLDTVFEALD